MKAWRHSAVQPLCDMLAESDTEHLAPMFGTGLTVEIESDTVDDAELLEQQLQNDLAARTRTRNEWRAVRGMPPLPGPQGDELVGNDNPKANPNLGASPTGETSDGFDSNQLRPQSRQLRLFKSIAESMPEKSHLPFEHLPAPKSDDVDQSDASQNDSTERPSVSRETRRRAKLIAEILYGIYGDAALHFFDQHTDQKAWDPSRHPRNELGEFRPLGSPEEIAAAQLMLRHLVTGGFGKRDDPATLNVLRHLTNKQLEEVHWQFGVMPPPKLGTRLIESIIVRLEDKERPFTPRTDGFDIYKHPNAKGVEVYVLQEDLLNDYLGRSIEAGNTIHGDEWGHLVGALPGARVYVYPKRSTEYGLSHVEISVVHSDYMARRKLVSGPNGGRSKTIENELLEVNPQCQRTGIAAQVLSKQIEAAAKHGYITLKTTGVGLGKKIPARFHREGEEDVGGYFVWPKLGYDGPLSPIMSGLKNHHDPDLNAIAYDFKKRFPKVKYVSELMNSDEGRTWWNDYGSHIDLKFDLRPESPSRQMFEKYLERKKREKNENKAMVPLVGTDERRNMNMSAFSLSEASILDNLPKFSHPEWGENPDPLTEEDEVILNEIWDRLGEEEKAREEKRSQNQK